MNTRFTAARHARVPATQTWLRTTLLAARASLDNPLADAWAGSTW